MDQEQMAIHDQMAIRRLEDERYDALQRSDYTTFESMCHPELTYVHSSGVVDTRDSYLGKLREGYYDYHWIDHPLTRLVINGDIALVWGDFNADITASGVQKQLRNRCLSVWVRDGATWLLLAYQPTPVPAPA